MTRAEIAFTELGIVTDSSTVDGNFYQYAKFDSPHELITKIQAGFSKGVFKNSEWAEHNGENTWAFGGEYPSYKETYDAIELGMTSEKTVKRALSFKQRIMEKPEIKELVYTAKTKKKKRVFAESGNELDIDRVLCGDPQHWTKTTSGNEKQVLRIGLKLGAVSTESHEVISNMAAFGIAVCDIISLYGYSTEITALYLPNSVNAKIKFGGTIVKIKDAYHNIDINNICLIGLPGIFRSFHFSVIQNILDMGIYEHAGFSNIPIDDNIKNMLGMDFYIDNSINEDNICKELLTLLTTTR